MYSKTEPGRQSSVPLVEDEVDVVLPAKYETVLIGSGPVGLLSTLAALKFAEKDNKVALIADRKEELGIREQVLWIQQDVYDFVKSLVGAELITKLKMR